MSILTFYNRHTSQEDSQGELGVLNLDHEFISVMVGAGINPQFHRYLTRRGVDSLKVICRSGTGRLRCENRPDKDGQSRYYWYAYKKVNGKLNKTYVGVAADMTEDVIENAIAKVNTVKPKVTQSDCVTTQTDAIAPTNIELAGHGKSDRYLQPSLPLPTVTDKAQSRIKSLESANKALQDELQFNKDLNDQLYKLQNDYHALKMTIAKYRELAEGKTKKDNPRFAYLIDFLADIDKLC